MIKFAIIVIDADRYVWINDSGINYLGNMFIDPAFQDKGAGTIVWKFIEKTYPNTVKWCTETPAFSRKNHNFYINKCGFKVVRIDSKKMKCHNCGNILSGKKGLIECGCGGQYLFRDYMRSFRANNMPTGAASHIFNRFIDNWPKARVYNDKMRLIDNLIHEFHINLASGVKGRFVGINLIEGTKRQIGELILSLAYT